jgi:uncharacterized membrane protein
VDVAGDRVESAFLGADRLDVATSLAPAAGAPLVRPRPGHPRLNLHPDRTVLRALHVMPLFLALLAFAGYSAVALNDQHDALTTAYDLGIFHQAMLSWSHFQLPVSALKNSTEHLPPDTDLLSDHFHPILVLLVPTYWIWPHPTTLLIDQAVLLAASILPVHAFCRRRVNAVLTVVLCLGYAGSIGIQSAVGFDFHEVAFAPLLIALAIERADARSWRWATASALMLLLVKEDLGLLLPFLGVLFFLWGARRLALVLAGTGIGGFLLITQVVMPALGNGTYAYWTYSSLGPTPASAVRALLLHPLRALMTATAAGARRHSLLQLFTPFGPLPLLSPVFVLAIPSLAERYLSDRSAMWSNAYQYELTMMPVLILATADTLQRSSRWLQNLPGARGPLLVAAGALLLVGTAAVTDQGGFPFAASFSHTGTRNPALIRALRAAVARVPRGVTVAATDRLVPQLLDRDDVSLLTGADPHTAWIVMEPSDAFVPWQVTSPAGIASYTPDEAALERAGYRVVLSNSYVSVLAR